MKFFKLKAYGYKPWYAELWAWLTRNEEFGDRYWIFTKRENG